MSEQINPVTMVCVHEAGHAVMMHIRGMHVTEVRINREHIKTHMGAEGYTQAITVRIRPQIYAEIAVAGVVAESMMLGVCPMSKLERLTDNEEMNKAMDALMISVDKRPTMRREIMNAVKEVLSKHVDKMLKISELVEKNDVVKMDEFEKIMGCETKYGNIH